MFETKYDFHPQGTVGKIQELQKSGKYFELKEVLESFLFSNELLLEHPLNSKIITKCRSNYLVDIFPSNILFFSDENNEHKWFLIQGISMVDAVFVDNILYSNFVDESVTQLCRRSMEILFDTEPGYMDYFTKRHTFGGLVIDCERPMHFFFDHLVDLYQLKDSLEHTHKKVLCLNHCFFDISLLLDNAVTRVRDTDKFYIFPDIIAAQSLVETKFSEHLSILDNMISALCRVVPEENELPDKKYDLVLWIGIAGEKRSWFEQIEGYANIINALQQHFPSMYILFDGMTATAGNEIEDQGNKDIAKKIMQGVDAPLDFKSLAGKDYMTKMSYCKDIDIFISDAGTTSVVPYRFYKKPGVLHWSAGYMYLFEPTSIHKKVRDEDIKSEEGKALGQASYSMDWKVVYNLTAEILNEIKDLNILTLKLDKY